MKMFFALMLAIMLSSGTEIYSQTESNLVEFSITAEKQYQATELNILVAIEEENKLFSVAVEKCEQKLSDLKGQLESLINSKKIEYSIKKYNSFPVYSIFKDYYRVQVSAIINLKEKSALGELMDRINVIEDLEIKAINFKYMDNNEIVNDLIKEASRLAEKKVKTYEECFKVKLELVSFSENLIRNGYQNYNNMIFNETDYSDNPLLPRGKGESNFPGLTQYPEKTQYLTLFFRYKIIK